MVFESIVVDILNKFLGDYVENLDRSQLKIGIWGGDVSLKNLSLKPSALDDLNLPVKTVYGHLGKLVLKIPWKNIYTAPVEVYVENLFLLVNPIQDIKYDEEKEEKFKQEAKQALINKVEEAKKKEKEKGDEKVDDTFVEKLAAQIIKNVQIFIGGIHVRYEDRVTKPESPFSIGISLHTLKIHTTNERCDSYVLPENESPLFYKIMVMEGLSVYWNTDSTSFVSSGSEYALMHKLFIDGIASKSHKTIGYNYILGPINSDAKLQINSKPETLNFITPKIFLSIILEQLLMNIRRSQYQDLIALLETFDRMAKAAPYRKYRPHLQTYKGHYKEWWNYAISCTMVDVKRRCNNWNWSYILNYRKLCKRYQAVYKSKLTEKISEQLTKELTELERDLDAFNIILIRQKVENEVERLGRLNAEQKASKKGGWFGWFSSSNKTATEENDENLTGNIVKQLESAMNDEEKEKLYRAIDYHESVTPTSYPTSFVAIRLEFVLRALKIVIIDDHQLGNQELTNSTMDNVSNYVMTVKFKEVMASVTQRPAVQSYAISLTMQSFQTLGLLQKGIVPKIIQSKLSASEKGDASKNAYFLNIFFETNPEDEKYDQRLHITLRPLKVVYDAQTLIKILEVFTPQKDISTVKNQIQAAANNTLEEMKEKSAVKLQYAIEKSTRLDLKVDLMAPYLILPFGGFYTKNEIALVINLGRITIASKSKDNASVNVRRMLKEGSSEDEVFNQMMLKCYDCFKICLGEMQILSLKPRQKWKPVIGSPSRKLTFDTDLHILQPTSIYVDIYKCVVEDDPRLPKIRIEGSLPDVTIRITEKTLLEIVSLIISLPLPNQNSSPETVPLTIEPLAEDDGSTIYDSASSLRQKLESLNRLQFTTLKKYRRTAESDDENVHNEESKPNVDYINLDATFNLKAITVYVECDEMKQPLIEASVITLQLSFVQRMYSSEVSAKLGKISLLQNYNDSIVPAISTPVDSAGSDQYLFFCKLLIAEKTSPVFEKLYHSTAITLHADFTKLYAMAHQEAIMNTIQWVTDLQNRIMNLLSANDPLEKPSQINPKAGPVKRRKSSASSNVSTVEKKSRRLKTKSALAAIVEDQLSDINTSRAKRNSASTEITELKVNIELSEIQVCLQTASRPLATMYIDGMVLSTSIRKSSTVIDAILHSVSVCDLNPETIYNKVAYVAEGKHAFTVSITLYNHELSGMEENNFDVLVAMQMNSLQCVFINEFVMDVLEFVNNFQSSKKMIAEASAAAVASAKMNVQQVYQSSTRVRLDIFADAPVILVPRNNRSSEIFIIDFGNFSIKNSLKKLSNAESSGHSPIIDEINIILKDMKVIRTNYERTAPEQLLLDPVNYQLLVKRNLSVSWYTEVPDFDISGEFRSIHATVTTDDYAMIMKTLQENLGSSGQNASQSKSSASESLLSAENEDIIQPESNQTVADCHETSEIEKIRTMVKFVMTIENVIIDLYTVNNDKKDGLARFTLSTLGVNGSMLTNMHLNLRALLSNCCLDDTRSSKAANPVKRYMQRKTVISHYDDEDETFEELTPSGNKSPTRSMIDVIFEKDACDMRVKAHVYSFILIFNVDHIMKIQEFFTSEFADSTGTGAGAGTATKISKKHESVPQTDVVKAQASPGGVSVMICSVTIEKPDIILVENLDDLNTNAIILNNEANVQIQFSNDNRLAVSGILQDLQLYSCCYNPEKRSQTASLILHPVTVYLNGSSSENGGLHLDVKVTEFNVSITAGTIALLTKIFSTLVPSVEDESTLSENNVRDYSDVWHQKTIKDGYWFLEMEQAEDALAVCATDVVPSSNSQNQINEKRFDVIMIAIPVVGVTLEAGVGKKTIPLLALRSSFQGTLKKSIKELNLESYISLEIGYYNSRLALWEPIIEPIQQPSTNSIISSKCIPWKLQFNCKMLNKTTDETDGSEENDESVISTTDAPRKSAINEKQALLSLYFNSDERIELTFTKTCMDVVKTLTQSFNDAVSLKSVSTLNMLHEVGSSCYVFVNEFGVDVELLLTDDQPFRVISHVLIREDVRESFCDDATGAVTVPAGETVRLYKTKIEKNIEEGKTNEQICLLDKLNVTTDRDGNFLRFAIPCRNKTLALPVSRADKRYFTVKSNDGMSETWGLISEVDIVEGSIIVTIRSVVRVYNHFAIDIFVYSAKSNKSKVELCQVGKVNSGQHLNIPVSAVYGSKGQLFFAPERYNVSAEPIIWKDLQKTVSFSKQLCCISKNAENEDPFFIRVLGEMEQVYNENTAAYTVASTAYSIHLRPTLILKNFLPINVVCCLQGVATEYVLGPGQNINVCTAEPDRSTVVLRLDNYLDKVWSCKKIIKADAPIFSVWTFASFDSEKTFTLNLGVWYSNQEDSMIFALYCPYWMVNKTGLNLSYKGVEDGGMILHHPKTFEEPILFSFKEKSFFSKKKACVRVTDGEWSDKFSIDVAGNSGSVSCSYKNQIYQLGVYIRLNYNTLTKQVIFSPFFTVANNCPFVIELRESRVKNAEWIAIASEACIPFWPKAKEDIDRVVELRIANTIEITSSFSYLKIRTHTLKLYNSYGGLQADVQVTEGGVYIAITAFQPKMAAALIINDTDLTLEFTEIDLVANTQDRRRSLTEGYKYETWSLQAKKEMLFNWSTASIEKPVLIINKSATTVDLRKDGVGELFDVSNTDNTRQTFWISFLYGMQRVLLITADAYIVSEIEAISDFEQTQQLMEICLKGIGFSLVNNLTKQELLYLSISSSQIVWEVQKQDGKRFKAVGESLNRQLEEAYTSFRKISAAAGDEKRLNLDQEIVTSKDSTITVNFNKGCIVKPSFKRIRRVYSNGLWLQIRSSERYKQIHAKINRLQIDNQIYDCVFPVIFSPVPPPRSVASPGDENSSGQERPFAELSIVQRIDEYATIKQFKYFKVLVQEFHVKVDIGFVNGLVKFLEADCVTDEEELSQFLIDKKVTKEPLCVHVSSVTSQDFYDVLHFSPLKIHISFSLCGENPSEGTPQQGLPFVNLLTQSVGVTLTDVNDVVFRLAYFERKHKFYSQPQLISEVKTHYIGQFVKQLYVLVLGLDVLGNPFGLVTGLKQGVEDFFYEPFQGAIQGPSEFAEGVLLGVRSLFGHTVGGAAGAVGRITGAMGKGIAALTLDEDYQKKRRQRLAQQQSSIAEGSRGLVMGVVEGVGGVISKPISGAREEGVEGFVKGVGKGMVGLFMRPASGVVDFASGTVDVVRRVTTFSDEVRRYRLPRYFKENGLVVPYSEKEAQGIKFLLDTEKGRFVSTDSYVFHIPMIDSNQPDKEVLLVTNNRIIYLIKSCDIFSDNIKVEWQYTWNEIKEDGITESEYGVCIRVDSNDNRRPASSPVSAFGSLFKRASKGKVLIISDKDVKKWLVSRMKELARKANRSL